MNTDIHDSGFDSLLILFPGSAVTREGIRLLAEISGLDHFIIQNKLKIKLPQILCPVHSRNIAGAAGDALETLGIHFMAVMKPFFDLPFKPFTVFSCAFGKKRCRFYSSSHHSVEIHNEEKILLLEGVYHTTDNALFRRPGMNSDVHADSRQKKSVYSNDIKTYRVVMLYQVMDSSPLVFIDRVMDFSFLGTEKQMTVMENFNAVKQRLETLFSCKADQGMLRYGYFLEQVQLFSEQKAKGFRLKSHREVITTSISNEAATHRMSRLLFFQWCKERGWVKRIMPAL